ncbi:thrombospondin type 3 repeat-containing protein [Methylomarinum vadi]|uniref:thrombospondin type 3 repeat-containing protein n=1 Tax=Methylomarinum vadi TaxID=438855 RepID=UPI0012687FFC|nr:thrombospondin type 3 repeat-containing protein [Methylomarinum vadi]
MQQISGLARALLIMLLYTVFSHMAYAQVGPLETWENVDGVSVEQSDRFYARGVGYYTYNKIHNDSGSDISGPLRLVVTSSTHTVLNADGTDESGYPFFNALAQGDSLADGEIGDAIRIDFAIKRGAFAYTVVVQKLVESVVDTDGDGIPDETDICPLDPGNDVDGDGICAAEDVCPNDAGNDVDGDGICAAEDVCPNDAGNDADGDGICAAEDVCPNDAGNDADGDGICAAEDMCPNDATNSCITINGQVFGAGSSLSGASIKIGLNSVTTVSNDIGQFTADVGSSELANDNLNDFFPIEVTATGFSSGYAKVVVEPGRTSYDMSINLQPVSDTISEQEDVTQGVEINKGGDPVGSLTIPVDALPVGVSTVTGSVTYLDPTTDDLQSAPGGDLLALPEGANPNEVVPLESFGMMEFDLEDQDGNPIHELGGNAEVCMKATPGLAVGDTIPLWWYDEAAGLWKEEGQGVVADRNGQLMICGNVTHFTWWNYDQPVTTHSCFKFDFIDESTGDRLYANLDWQAEGVTYNGLSPERACNTDTNDPVPPAPGTIDSLTVKRTTDVNNPEQIRVFAEIGGGKFYLVRDGDGTYSLSQDQSQATVFDNPEANGSCLNNTDVQNCQFLDYLDGGSADGILPLSSDINYPPLISDFTVGQANLMPGATTAVSASVIDPEGSGNVSITWETECGWYSQSGGGSISPTSDGGVSGSVFNATFTAPDTLDYLYESCRITLTATDADGVSASADRWVYIANSFQYTVQGVLYGTDGLPMANTSIQYYNYQCTDINQDNETDQDGNYHFDIDLTACAYQGDGIYYPSLGQFWVSYDYQNQAMTHDEYIDNYNYYQNNICSVQPDSSTLCQYDIRLPTVWAPISGNLYPPAGSSFNNLYLSSWSGNSGESFEVGNLDQSSYGPYWMPLGQGDIMAYDSNYQNWWYSDYQLLSTEGVTQDIGDASAPVTVKIFDDQGVPLSGVEVTLNGYSGSAGRVENSGTTDEQGEFTAIMPLGYVYANISSEAQTYYGWGRGNVKVKDQPVFIDIGGPDTCNVVGTAFNSLGQPESPGMLIGAYNYAWSPAYFDGYLQTSTDAEGNYLFNGVRPGSFEFTDSNFSYWWNYYYIDNCRSTDGSPREIRIDRPFFDPQYEYLNF